MPRASVRPTEIINAILIWRVNDRAFPGGEKGLGQVFGPMAAWWLAAVRAAVIELPGVNLRDENVVRFQRR